MDSITHALKTLILFYLGLQLRNLIFGDVSFFFNLIFYIGLIHVAFKHYMSYKPMRVPPSDFKVCIIGAGFSGIAMAVKLKEIGVDYQIIEKGDRFGGTWWDNQYPGCECDVSSHLYSFSFELNPDWSNSFSPQPEIHQYLERVAEKYDLQRHVMFRKRVLKTTWDENNSQWEIELDSGETLTANVLISGTGALHVPVTPDFPGKDSFKGEAFHSAHWKKDFNPTGKRVAVIGTGASAVQIVPAVAPKVSHLTVFQRTPCWVPPKRSFTHPKWLLFLFRFYPFIMFLFRNYYYWRSEIRFMAVFRMEGMLRKKTVELLTKHTMHVVQDPKVAKKLIPSFEVGCKRLTPSNEYLQSYNRDNVTLETETIDCFTEEGIKTKDGTLHKFDAIIFATGFSPAESYKSYSMFGRNTGKDDKIEMNGHANGIEQKSNRVSLADSWEDFPNAYKGITCPGYPNMFILLGPGTGLGHSSVVYMIECQVAYAIDAIRNMIETNIRSVDVKKRVNDDYQEWVQEWMKNKVFNSTNCLSWYKNKAGINYTLWPSNLPHYWWQTKTFDIKNYICKYK